jgi:hypothetical protein
VIDGPLTQMAWKLNRALDDAAALRVAFAVWRERALAAEALVRAKDETIGELTAYSDQYAIGYKEGWRDAMNQSRKCGRSRFPGDPPCACQRAGESSRGGETEA